MGAAVDTFNKYMTPGQALLQSFKFSELHRRDRMKHTLSAKMRAARDKIGDIQARSPKSCDAALFPSPRDDVHCLDFDLKGNRTRRVGMMTSGAENPDRLSAMLERKRARHEEARNLYQLRKSELDAKLLEGITEIGEEAKASLEEVNVDVEAAMMTLAESEVMNMEEKQIEQVFHNQIWQILYENIQRKYDFFFVPLVTSCHSTP